MREKKSDKKYTIVAMPKFIGVPFFNRFGEGYAQAAEDLGVEIIYTGPTEGDATQQVSMLEDLINTKDIDAIIIGPNDPETLSPVLQKAKEMGIYIASADTQANLEDIEMHIAQVDDDAFGAHMWDKMVEYMGTDEGQYAIITGSLTADNLNQWIDAGMANAAKNYPNLEYTTTVECNDEQSTAYSQALDLLTAYPDLKGIVGVSTLSPLGAAQAVQELGLQGKVAVVGTAMPSDSAPFLHDGSMSVANLWDPYDSAYFSAWAVVKALDGGYPEVGDTIDAINVKIPRIDGKMIYMDSTGVDFTADNVDDYPF